MTTVKPIFDKVRFSAVWRQICTEVLLEIVGVLRKSLGVKLYLFYITDVPSTRRTLQMEVVVLDSKARA